MNYKSVKPLAADTLTNNKNKGILIIGGAAAADITIVSGTVTGATASMVINVPVKTPIIYNVHVVSWSGSGLAGVFELF